MGREAFEQFMTQVEGSAYLQTRIGKEIGADALVALGADHGREFTVEEVRAAGTAESPGELRENVQAWADNHAAEIQKTYGLLPDEVDHLAKFENFA